MAENAPAPDEATEAFSGRMLRIAVERWGDAEREIVERADSVAVVAVEGDDNVVLVRQFREAARRAVLELPAGTVDEGEDPLATAKRELAEETGLRGGRWRTGPVAYTTPGFCRERIHLFLADGLEGGEAAPEGDEEIELVRWRVAEVAGRLGEIEDAKTVAGLLLLLRDRGL